MNEGLSRREAAKRFGIHRNTKMLSFSVPPGYRQRPGTATFTRNSGTRRIAIRLGLGSRAVSISLEGHDILVRSRHDGDDESNARIKLTSALSPPFVNARVRFLAPLPGEGGIVGIPFGAAAVVGGRIVRI